MGDSDLTVLLTPASARLLATLVSQVVETRGLADFVTHVDRDDRGRASLIISRLPASVERSPLLEAIANKVLDGSVSGIRALSDQSDPITGLKLVVELDVDVDPAATRQQLDVVVQQFHSVSAAFAPSLLAELVVLAAQDGAAGRHVPIDQDFADLLQQHAQDLAWGFEERDQQAQQVPWETLAHALNGVEFNQAAPG